LVIELTGSYVYGLSSLVGLAVAIGFTHTRYGASYFDLQLLKRGIDIAEGRMGLYLQETAVISFAKQNFEKVALLGNVGEAQTLMSKNQTTELVVVDEDKRFVGKVDAAALIGINSEMSLESYVDKACTVIHHDASLKAAMEIASDFVGELIPIVDANSGFVIGVISENALFEAYLNEQQKVLEMEKK
jgi:CIC family chloride channel protein